MATVGLRFGPPSLNRMPCPGQDCGPESLHKYGKCCHCKRQNYGDKFEKPVYSQHPTNGSKLKGRDPLLQWSTRKRWQEHKARTYRLRIAREGKANGSQVESNQTQDEG